MAVGWEDSELFPEGLFLNLLLAGETFNSFQMNGIAKKNGQHIYKLDILGEYKRRSEKCLFDVTAKIVTKLNKNK